jgi:micrococcal nuclease
VGVGRIVAAIALAILCWSSGEAQPVSSIEAVSLVHRLSLGTAWLAHAEVVRIIDGDTVVVNLNLGWHTWRHQESVRLDEIDAPERGHAKWAQAKSYVESLLPPGTKVLVVSGEMDKYGRTLGRILRLDGTDVGFELLKRGLAQRYDGGKRTPSP